MSERPHLSATQIEMLSRCEKQWEFRYAYGLKVPPGVALTIGKGTHKGVEKNLDRKMAWGALMEPAEVQDVTRDAVMRLWERDPPLVREGDPNRGESVDIAVSLAAIHHDKLAPTIEPVALEQAFVIETPDFPFDLMGVVDIETPTHVRDTKTAAKKPDKAKARRSPQLALYHLRSTLAGGEGKKTALDYLVKTQVRQVVTVEAEPDGDEHIALLRRLELAAASIQSGVFKPTWTGDWNCSERFCGYWDRCEFGSRKRVSVGLIDPARLTTRVIQLRNDDTALGDDDTPGEE